MLLLASQASSPQAASESPPRYPPASDSLEPLKRSPDPRATRQGCPPPCHQDATDRGPDPREEEAVASLRPEADQDHLWGEGSEAEPVPGLRQGDAPGPGPLTDTGGLAGAGAVTTPKSGTGTTRTRAKFSASSGWGNLGTLFLFQSFASHSYRVFLSPFGSYDTDERDLRRTFGKFGDIEQIKLVCDPEGRSRGFGFISFYSLEVKLVLRHCEVQ